MVRLAERTLSLAPAEESDDYVGELRLINGSNEPLTVDNIRTNCGCTVADWPVSAVAGGDTLALPVTLHCRGKGEQTQTLEVWLAGYRAPLRASVTGACAAGT